MARLGLQGPVMSRRGPSGVRAVILGAFALCAVPLGADEGGSPPTVAPPDGRADWRSPAPTSKPSSVPVGAGVPGTPEAASEPLAMPIIEPLPTQIVNAGRVIRWRVRAHLDDGRSPRLTIDPLPASASFDENPDGSHTLHWPTRERDQGDHRLRITAVHPNDETRASGADLLVVVGGSDEGGSRRSASVGPVSTASARRPLTVVGTLSRARKGVGTAEHDILFPDVARAPHTPPGDRPAHRPQDPGADPSVDYFRETEIDAPAPDRTLDAPRSGGERGGYFDRIDVEETGVGGLDPRG